MRVLQRFAKVGRVLVLTIVFTAAQLIPRPGRPAYAQTGAPPLPVPEDPLGQQPEQETPETYINVNIRDLHLVVRAVDIWGPGRVPLVYRLLTNTQPSSLSGPGQWHLNHFMAGVGREPDGMLWTYKFLSTRLGPGQYQVWETYVKDIGTYQTMEQLVYCPPPPPPDPQGGQSVQRARLAPSTFTQRVRVLQVQTLSAGCSMVDGYQYVYLPKGVVRTYLNGLIAADSRRQQQRHHVHLDHVRRPDSTIHPAGHRSGRSPGQLHLRAVVPRMSPVQR